MKSRSSWSYHKTDNNKKIAYIKDDDLGGLSVTNDAEAVCEEVASQCPGYRIIYRDSDGAWDELLHKNGKFIWFGHVEQEDMP